MRPQVIYTQKDLSQYVAGAGATVAGVAGNARWGEVDTPKLFSSYSAFVEHFGKPVSPAVTPLHYQVLGFFKTGRNLYCIRPQGTSKYGGVEALLDTEAAAIAAGLTTLPSVPSGSNVIGIYTKYPGVHDEGSVYVNIHTVDDETGTFGIQVGTTLDGNGAIDTSHSSYEDHTVSVLASSKDGYGRSMFIKDVLDRDSVLVTGRAIALAGVGDVPANSTGPAELAQASYTAASDANIAAAYDLFKPLSSAPINLLFQGNFTTTVLSKVLEVVDVRQDCFAVVSPGVDETWDTDGIVGGVGWLSNITNRTWRGGAWAALFKDKDEYNDTDVIIPASGYIAGMIANSDYISDVFYAPAGVNRGRLTTDLEVEWTEAEQDLIYDAKVNFAAKSLTSGVTAEGQKTLYSVNSSLDRINVARLMIQLRGKAIEFTKGFLYEFNDEFNRSLIQTGLQDMLDDYIGKSALQDGRAICDESNNTAAVIDRNELVVDLYVKPSKAIEWLYVKTTITASGINLDDIVAVQNPA